MEPQAFVIAPQFDWGSCACDRFRVWDCLDGRGLPAPKRNASLRRNSPQSKIFHLPRDPPVNVTRFGRRISVFAAKLSPLRFAPKRARGEGPGRLGMAPQPLENIDSGLGNGALPA